MIKNIEKYFGDFKNMDYTFFQKSREIKKNKIIKNKKEKIKWQKTKQEMK
jgi:hypothetical protein|tara:strand:+ start:192 stop:341 length:150 start_codon:yes stop_codon:yes gene_type:complete